MMKRYAAVLLLLSVSCAAFTPPPATPESKDVVVTSNNQLTVGCTLLGSIEAPDRMKVGDSATELANKAAAMGGKVVLLTRKIDVTQYAEVYRCPAPSQ
jgi:hypothetical protein